MYPANKENVNNKQNNKTKQYYKGEVGVNRTTKIVYFRDNKNKTIMTRNGYKQKDYSRTLDIDNLYYPTSIDQLNEKVKGVMIEDMSKDIELIN